MIVEAIPAPAAITVHDDQPGHRQRAGHPPRDEAGEAARIDAWQQIYEVIYGAADAAEFGEDFSGWLSSYDGMPIPLPEMQEWRARVVERIRALSPRRVLEIGVGSGLLLSQLALDCEAYWATDFSRETVTKLRQDLPQFLSRTSRVELRVQAAHVIDGLPVGFFDTIILNSVIQYFPSFEYFLDVLDQALHLLTPGGSIFIGDVRNLHLQRRFATATTMHKVDRPSDPGELQRRIEAVILAERELLLAPEFFALLPKRLAAIAGVDIQIKRGNYANELTRYRYDVVLHKAPSEFISLREAGHLQWGQDVADLGALQACLAQQRPSALRLTQVPNSRLKSELSAVSGRELEGHSAPAGLAGEPPDIDAIYKIADELDYDIGITWGDAATAPLGGLEVLLWRPGGSLPIDLFRPERELSEFAAYANNPIAIVPAGGAAQDCQAAAEPGPAEILSLPPLQEGLLFHALYDKEAPDPYIVQTILELTGPLDAEALQAAARTLLRRHAHLSAGFVQDGHEPPVQIIRHDRILPWQEFELTGMAPPAAAVRLDQILAADRARFDPARAPLLRFTLIRLDILRYRLAITHHLIVLDSWSMPVLTQELMALYDRGGDSGALPPAIPHRDYLAWLGRQDRAAARAAWREALGFLSEQTRSAPVDNSSPPLPETVQCELPTEFGAAIAEQGQQHGLILDTRVQGAWGLMLADLTGSEDVVFGISANGRPAEFDGARRMVGQYGDTVPMRVRLRAEETVYDLLTRLQREQLRLSAHRHLGLSEIQQLAGVGGLFDTLVIVETDPIDPGLDNRSSAVHAVMVGGDGRGVSHYPLNVFVRAGRPTQITLGYRPDLFDRETATSLARRLIWLLERMAASPDLTIGQMEALDWPNRPAAWRSGQVSRRSNDLAAQGESAWSSAEPGEAAADATAPAGDVEIALATIWGELLQCERVSRTANFFEIGGHSLLAMRMVSRLREVFGIDFAINQFYACPILSSLAEQIIDRQLAQFDPVELQAILGDLM